MEKQCRCNSLASRKRGVRKGIRYHSNIYNKHILTNQMYILYNFLYIYIYIEIPDVQWNPQHRPRPDESVIESLADKWLSATQMARGPEVHRWKSSMRTGMKRGFHMF